MLSFFEYCSYSFVACFFAILGDFVESFVKRCADKKDSGRIFPGHGGLLDRVRNLFIILDRFYRLGFTYNIDVFYVTKFD